ncbi:alpha/beta fold hydrolase [Rhodopila sp.]|jgi:pimeloyl-ACP methyl ester carboxylesterase|uniref:alpha/beta fold hydrolase n=1 Tax=Rhodopila sp. TaxID=2480087 RepID=UPI002BDF589A|nr:alpha/beta fold hydrolase [Rhodopila sp.]HVZ08015.1 alpha/beta fold hydrolase [Rhodopila sp.]
MMAPFGPDILPAGIRARMVPDVNGLTVHLLEAGEPGHPCVLLLHGFPELAWSWRKVMPGLAQAGYRVLAPDLRGYGRTTGWDAAYDTDLTPFGLCNEVLDMLCLLARLDIPHVRAVVGHDYGASVAAWCALTRPDIFRSMTIMSAPFGGPPDVTAPAVPDPAIHRALSLLDRPRKHYHWYYSTREANADMWHCRQGVHDFLRAYYHHKSGDWAPNKPFRLAGWTAEALARMPTYYIMDHDRTMAETVAPEMPTPSEIEANTWLTEAELRIYSSEYQRTGFQGGLQHYRVRTAGVGLAELKLFAGRTIDQKSMFVAGRSDWGIYQAPGAIERMQEVVCPSMTGVHLLDGAGHWVQQEKAAEVTALLVDFLKG